MHWRDGLSAAARPAGGGGSGHGVGDAVSATGADLETEDGSEFSPPECLACGACCFSTASDYVPVKGDDWTRLGPDAVRWAVFVNNRAFMRMVGGHCAALRVEPASAERGAARFVCSIYETRPQVCRDLARGSGECHGEWTLKRTTAILASEAASGQALKGM
tara:strand:+ start:75 stop:560 length:486 start_codon:yes stop_codon:yes gene_type:complete